MVLSYAALRRGTEVERFRRRRVLRRVLVRLKVHRGLMARLPAVSGISNGCRQPHLVIAGTGMCNILRSSIAGFAVA